MRAWLDPLLGDVATDQLRQPVNILQAPYAVRRIVVEFLHVLLEPPDRKERAVASKVADPDWRILKCRVSTVVLYGNGARAIADIGFIDKVWSQWIQSTH
jgi:hypothetical protein